MTTEYPQEMIDMLGEPEELDPELAACVQKLSTGTFIKHPLVNEMTLPGSFHRMHNEMLRQKKAALERAEDEEDWELYVMLHERPWRAEAFSEIAGYLADRQYWELLGEVWIDTENLWQWADQLPDLLRSGRPGRRYMMTGEERRHLSRLADPVIVYRGHHGANAEGWSWTYQRHKAEWFARRLAFGDRVPHVSRGRIAKRHVLACFTRRNEQEIVADPARIEGITTKEIPLKDEESW